MINYRLEMTSVHRKGVKMMKKLLKFGFMMIIAICVMGVLLPAQASAKVKSKKITLDINGDYGTVKRPSALDKAKRVVVKSSKKSVATGKYSKKKGDRRVDIVAKKKGKATITVKCYYPKKKMKTIRYKVTVVAKHKMTDLEKSKEAFRLQNQYRKSKGSPELQWSDEIYQFCLYRMKTSGFDKHKYLGRDTINYFGNFARGNVVLFAENMTTCPSIKGAIQAWKDSPLHNENMLDRNHVCGAMGTYKGIWFALFLDKDKSFIDSWRDYHLKQITVKRYDTTTGLAIAGSSIGYYEVDNRQGTLKSVVISKREGEPIYLEIGKTYVIYERIRPDGLEKAESVTITVTEDGVSEVILTSNQISGNTV